MKLYRVKIPVIAKAVIDTLTNDNSIEVDPVNKGEAEQDLVAIMEEYLRRDNDLQEAVRQHMADRSVPYEQRGKVRTAIASDWSHPQGDDVERYLARQFVENFMISNFVEEVYADDTELYKRIVDIIRSHDVDERAIRDEAKEKIKNIPEGTVDYEIALNKAIREVKKRHGLLVERSQHG